MYGRYKITSMPYTVLGWTNLLNTNKNTVHTKLVQAWTKHDPPIDLHVHFSLPVFQK